VNEIHYMKISTKVQFVIVEEELKSLRKKDRKLNQNQVVKVHQKG